MTPEKKKDYFEHFLKNRSVGQIDFRAIRIDCYTAIDTGLYPFAFSDGVGGEGALCVHMQVEREALAVVSLAYHSRSLSFSYGPLYGRRQRRAAETVGLLNTVIATKRRTNGEGLAPVSPRRDKARDANTDPLRKLAQSLVH